ncbi:MAG: hypothetical protein R3C49_19205 [Planctomycetaceae bacterium]
MLSWYLNGSLPWFMFWMVRRMEAYIGMDYARGLKMVKDYIESGRVDSQSRVRNLQSVGPLRIIGEEHAPALKKSET